ncbi:MAG: lytic murein transglycosylase [Acidobacteria bacterium]|nr:lytic murein transglycosylase [Acidobacteriota bacterium]
MSTLARASAAALAVILVATSPIGADRRDDTDPVPFAQWLDEVKREAVGRGIREETVRQAFDGIEMLEVVRERDRSQAEFVLTLDAYLKRRLTPTFTKQARTALRTHRTLLARVSAQYKVPPAVVIAIWGIESNFGRFTGVRPTVAALATLAWDPRRGPFFRGQLFDALTIVDRGDAELSMLRGSWAGAMGQPQFMPSSYLRYAEDFDGDGRRNIWTSPADVFASIANYLSKNGWEPDLRWGREVVVSDRAASAVAAAVPLRPVGCRAEREMTAPRSWNEWQALGITLPRGRHLPKSTRPASLVRSGDRAFLVSSNYESILTYNCAHHYALSVALLSERM